MTGTEETLHKNKKDLTQSSIYGWRGPAESPINPTSLHGVRETAVKVLHGTDDGFLDQKQAQAASNLRCQWEIQLLS